MAAMYVSDTLAREDLEFVAKVHYYPKTPTVEQAETRRVGLDATFLQCRCVYDCACMTEAVDIDKIRAPLILATDGGFKLCGDRHDEWPLAAVGVFVAKDSPLNVSEVLRYATVRLDQHHAETAAVLRALSIAKEMKEALKSVYMIIIKTDSARIVDTLSGERSDRRWSDKDGHQVFNHPPLDTRLLATIKEAVTDLEETTKLRTKFWWVPREENCSADALVKLAMDKEVGIAKAARTEWLFDRRAVQQRRRQLGQPGDLQEAMEAKKFYPPLYVPPTNAPGPWPYTTGPYAEWELGLRPLSSTRLHVSLPTSMMLQTQPTTMHEHETVLDGDGENMDMEA